MDKFKITVCILAILCTTFYFITVCRKVSNYSSSSGQATVRLCVDHQGRNASEYSGSINIVEKYLTLFMIFFIMGLYIKKKKYGGTINYHMIK